MSDRRFSFEVTRTTTAPPATLFRLETDGANWSRWAKPLIVQSSWERQGDPAPAGVGAIRRVGLWPVVMREETVEYEQDRRHVYVFADGKGPAKDYRAELVLTPTATGGTELRWTGSMSEGVRGTGPVVCAAMHGAIKLISALLVRAAEKETRP